MTSKKEVDSYLKQLKVKVDIFGILFLDDRGKNQQTLHDEHGYGKQQSSLYFIPYS